MKPALDSRHLRRLLSVAAAIFASTSTHVALASGIDSNSEAAERALADDAPPKSAKGSLAEWYGNRAAESATEHEDPPLTEADLRGLFPDLQVETQHSSPLKLLFGVTAPFQLFGLGLSTDIYVTPRLRLASTLAIGMTVAHPVNRDWEVNAYAEVGIGVVALRWLSSTTVSWPRSSAGDSRNQEDLHVTVPSSHALEVDAGALSGHAVLFRCMGDCSAPGPSMQTYTKAALQVTMPYAGLRYVYLRRAWSRSAGINKTRGFEVGVQAVYRPIVEPAADLFNVRGDRISRRSWGFRTVWRITGGWGPTGGGGSMNLSIGYLPSPGTPFFSVGFESS